MTLLREGQKIRTTYDVDRLLGEGAFAEVYRVRHRFLGRQAMKVFKAPGITAEETEAMLGEAIMLSQFDHPNIIKVFDADTVDLRGTTFAFFTMQYVAGGTLEKFWRSHGARFVPVDTAVDLLTQVSQGLAVAHAHDPPIVHRDVKPQNILVGYDTTGLRARVSDFGLAKQAHPITLLASARGTLSFKAPESLRDANADSCAGDVWALGCTLHLLLTDRLPYHDASETDLMAGRAFQRPVAPPSQVNYEVDGRLDEIVLRCLAVDPAQRHPDAHAVLEDLQGWRRPVPSATPSAKALPPESDKSALGLPTPTDARDVDQMVTRALALSRTGHLTEAADLMEEACNLRPELREQHAARVRTWRNGVTM